MFSYPLTNKDNKEKKKKTAICAKALTRVKPFRIDTVGHYDVTIDCK